MPRRSDATLEWGLKPQELRIVRVAYRLLGDRGSHAVTLDAIAAEAGVSKGILLYYFKTRENLVLATMRWVLEATAERIRAAMAEAATPGDRLQAMVDAVWIDPDTNRRFYTAYLDLAGEAVRNHSYSQLSVAYRTVVEGLYAEAVRGATTMPGGPDGSRIGAVIRALVDGIALQWLQEPDWRQAHPAYRELCRTAVVAYVHPG